MEELRDSFAKELEHLSVAETIMAADKRKTTSDIEEFYTRMVSLLESKKAELRSRLDEEHARGTERVGRRREALQGMMEEVEETGVVAEVLYMECCPLEVLTQFAPLKQQFDNLQYITPSLGETQVRKICVS
jgi:hypothetical protein